MFPAHDPPCWQHPVKAMAPMGSSLTAAPPCPFRPGSGNSSPPMPAPGDLANPWRFPHASILHPSILLYPPVYATLFHAGFSVCQSEVHFHLQPREKILESGCEGSTEEGHPTWPAGSGELPGQGDSEPSLTETSAGWRAGEGLASQQAEGLTNDKMPGSPGVQEGRSGLTKKGEGR